MPKPFKVISFQKQFCLAQRYRGFCKKYRGTKWNSDEYERILIARCILAYIGDSAQALTLIFVFIDEIGVNPEALKNVSSAPLESFINFRAE